MSYEENSAYSRGYGNDSTNTGYGNNQNAYKDSSGYSKGGGYSDSIWKHSKQNNKRISNKVILLSVLTFFVVIVYVLYLS